ncbi:MAG: transglycosylase domain-containing protein, partial [Acidimicrobiales bacterium]
MRARRPRMGELAVAIRPLQQDALRSFDDVVQRGLPALGRWTVAAARLTTSVLVVAARATGRCGRRCRPLLRPVRRVTLALAPRAGVVALAVGLVGWYAPGPLLDAAATFTSVDATPFPPLAQRSVVTAADGTPLGVVHGGQNRRVVDLDAVPPIVRHLVVLAEDRRFFEHDGFDQAAMVRAALANSRSGDVAQGGSTITQQLVKLNLVGGERRLVRKLRELVLSVAVEHETTKDELLSRYLNEVYFGSGAYGIAAAAETYFATTVELLRPDQAALLATLIRSPSLDPWRDPARATARRNALLRAAGDHGALAPAAARRLSGTDLGLSPAPAGPGVIDADLVRAVEAEIAVRPELGSEPAERLRRFRSEGWSVRTTIDPGIQEAARRAADQQASPIGAPGAAVAVVEPGTGRIRALHSRRPPDLADLDLASAGRRQPGSAFKPLAAIAALEAGLDPSRRLEGRSGVTFDLGREQWQVHNFGGADHRPRDLEAALRDSVNTAFAQIGVATGAERIADVAGRLGIDTEVALGPPAERGPALALGGVRHGVTALEMAGAYAAIADDGRYVPPTLIERIEGPDGREVLGRRPSPRQVVDPAVNARVRTMLQAAVSGGTGTEAALPGWPAFGKTGTSQDRADACFVGAVPDLAAAVWIGDPKERTPMARATGGSLAAPAWRQIMA